MKCMFGIYHMDEGEIYYEGEKIKILNPLDALHKGIAMVHQELQPIPERSIGENIYVGRYPVKSYGPIKTIDHKKMYEDAARVLKEVHLDFDPKAKLGTLSVSQMQLVEIAKAVSADCKVLILDEPTRGIDVGAKYEIYCIINDLVAAGKSVIMISSELPEVLGMSDRIYVMNEGRIVGELDAAEASQEVIMGRILSSSKGE